MRKLAHLLAVSGLFGDISVSNPPKYEIKRFKNENKFNLTDEEISLMETMTPKEKKKFLKSRNK